LNNFLLIESGSTKCDWAFVSDQQINHLHTIGINPITGAGLDQPLNDDIAHKLNGIDVIYFYGAGTNNPSATSSLKSYFYQNIGRHFDIDIQSDLLGAARAMLGDDDGIAAILGTGSNTCYYDGIKIISYTPSLGYLLSDEGSGNHIGKELIKAYFYNKMSEADSQLFFENYNITRDSLLHSLYKEPRVAAYLASFSPFLHLCNPELKTRILTKVFDEFVQVRIKNICNFSKFAIHFTGSIAYHFQAELSEVLSRNGCIMGRVLQSPLQKLIEYHKSREDAK
jgi:glucosamine kinase